jgi:hypothetical protein
MFSRSAKVNVTTLSIALSVASLLSVPAFAEDKVPGEKWKVAVTMEMSGMSMPSNTMEVCAPVGKAAEAVSRPVGASQCVVSDQKKVGNTTSAKISCTGKTPMEGDFEQTVDGNKMHGVTHMKAAGMAMTMKYESEKLGTACEAVDYSKMKIPKPVDSPEKAK